MLLHHLPPPPRSPSLSSLLSIPPSRIKRFKATDGMTSGFLPWSERKKNPQNQYTVLVYFHSACMTVTAPSTHSYIWNVRGWITLHTWRSSRLSLVSSCHHSVDHSFVVIICCRPHQVVTLKTELCHELLSWNIVVRVQMRNVRMMVFFFFPCH